MSKETKSKPEVIQNSGKGKSEQADSTREKYTLFYKKDSPFSQHYSVKFTVDGVIYNCAEQYMMHQKAVLFGDEKVATAILKTDCPKTMKKFGRKVTPFDKQRWTEKCRAVVKTGNWAKFSQNKQLKTKLFNTAGTIMVEASPRDRLWGIGLGAANPKAQDKKNWRGKNWLGYTLTEVRDELMNQENKDCSDEEDVVKLKD